MTVNSAAINITAELLRWIGLSIIQGARGVREVDILNSVRVHIIVDVVLHPKLPPLPSMKPFWGCPPNSNMVHKYPRLVFPIVTSVNGGACERIDPCVGTIIWYQMLEPPDHVLHIIGIVATGTHWGIQSISKLLRVVQIRMNQSLDIFAEPQSCLECIETTVS
jgi:hypothetical protein